MKISPLHRMLPIAVAIMLLVGCGKKSDPAATTQADAEVPVEVQPAALLPSTNVIQASGILAAKEEMRLAFKTGGVIRKVYVQPGESIKKGQRLAELDAREVGAGANAAREQLQKAERDYQRAVSLRVQEVIPQAQLDDAKTALNIARAANSSAGFNAETSQMIASGNGRVLRQFAEVNEVVAPGQPVFAVSDATGGYIIRIALSDRDALALQLNDSASVRIDAFADRAYDTLRAHVSALPGGANPATGLFDIELTLDVDQPLPALRSGLIAQVQINAKTDADQATEVMQIPVSALLEANGPHAVIYVIDAKNQAERRTISIGALREALVVVTDGLSLGEQVVTRGAAYLNRDSKVRVVSNALAQSVVVPEAKTP